MFEKLTDDEKKFAESTEVIYNKDSGRYITNFDEIPFEGNLRQIKAHITKKLFEKHGFDANSYINIWHPPEGAPVDTTDLQLEKYLIGKIDILENFNYQVNNGGLAQYLGNRYMDTMPQDIIKQVFENNGLAPIVHKLSDVVLNFDSEGWGESEEANEIDFWEVEDEGYSPSNWNFIYNDEKFNKWYYESEEAKEIEVMIDEFNQDLRDKNNSIIMTAIKDKKEEGPVR